MAYKYAKDLVTIKTQQTFSVEPHFSRAESKNDESPLPIVSSVSRFRATIINKERVAATARWTIAEVQSMVEDFKIARSLCKENEWKSAPATEGQNSPAYTVKIVAGSLKGMTPAEVVAAGRKEELNGHYSWLKDNLQKFPKNQVIMDAIMDAGRLDKEGKLEAPATAGGLRDMVIFESPMKPLMRNQKHNGKYPVYQSKVIVHPSNNYPVEVEITTFDAPVNKLQTGMLNVIAKEKENEQKNSMAMSFADFGHVLKEMEDYITYFKMLNARECYADSDACDKANREASKMDGAA